MNARSEWAVSVVDPAPDDRIVELGCGPGVAAALVCARLTTGHLTVVDRSPVAVARAAARNAAHIAAGRLTVVQSDVEGLVLPPASATKVFSVNVNVFWTRDPAGELAVLSEILRPGGWLFVLYGGGPTGAGRVTAPIAAALRETGFEAVERVFSADGIGVRGRRSGIGAR